MYSLNKVVLTLAVVLIMAVLSFLGVQAYGDKRAAQAELSGVKEAISEAVAARTEAGNTDAHQAREIVTKRDAVRRVVQRGREDAQAVTSFSSGCDAVGDAERTRLLNIRISEVNRIITESGELPD